MTLNIKLEVATRQDGDVWAASCLPLDVVTQADSKEQALSSLKEAVELWFESCIERNVLDQALREAGFQAMDAQRKPSRARGSSARGDYIEVSIPAYTTAA